MVSELLPLFESREPELDRNALPAVENLHDLRHAGLLRLNVPVHAGGLGGDLSDSVEALRLLAHASPSTALMLAMHNSTLANYLLDAAIVPAAQQEYFRAQRAWAWHEAASGKIFGVANSEPGAGGNVHASKTTVDEDGLRVSGLKSFASMGLEADYFMVVARHSSLPVEYYLVENDPERVLVERGWDATGMRGSDSVTLRFDSAPVIGPLGYRGLLDGPNNRHWSTLSFTAVFIGTAESLLAATSRTAEGMLQKTAAVELHLALQACRGMLRHCVATAPESPGTDYRRLVRDCKVFVTRTLAEKGAALFSAQGGGAYRFTSPVARSFRDLLAGPLLRPPVGATFDEIWEELSANGGDAEKLNGS
ncbi:MAG TPA: acyl-CoA dehydrogenase family protein [Thermoanaerobaculia bacterium]|nr:acyl-CoA dehydrogenase family protein [Thermoanaerobaculia bacterium]